MVKVKLDPSKVIYDGKGFRIVVLDEKKFKKKLDRLRKEVWKALCK